MQRQVVELFEQVEEVGQVEKKSAVITYCMSSGVSPTQRQLGVYYLSFSSQPPHEAGVIDPIL